jgi:hypothetical protein
MARSESEVPRFLMLHCVGAGADFIEVLSCSASASLIRNGAPLTESSTMGLHRRGLRRSVLLGRDAVEAVWPTAAS